MMRTRKHSATRRGTATVETAVVLPVYLVMLFGIVEFGHAQMVLNLLNSACRNGARIGSTEGTTTAQVVTKVQQTLGAAVPANKVTVYVRNADVYDTGGTPPSTDAGVEALPSIELANASARQMFVVRAKVAYNSICLVPMPFLKNVTLDSQSFMRHE
jgi:Flp pilus assembly protein TadG